MMRITRGILLVRLAGLNPIPTVAPAFVVTGSDVAFFSIVDSMNSNAVSCCIRWTTPMQMHMRSTSLRDPLPHRPVTMGVADLPA